MSDYDNLTSKEVLDIYNAKVVSEFYDKNRKIFDLERKINEDANIISMLNINNKKLFSNSRFYKFCTIILSVSLISILLSLYIL